MAWNFFYVKANFLHLKRVVITTNNDLTVIVQNMHKIGPYSVWIGQQLYALVYDFLNQHVNFFDP